MLCLLEKEKKKNIGFIRLCFFSVRIGLVCGNFDD